jgi:hypothetical protein
MSAAEMRAPSSWHVVRAITRREVGIALRRKLVRLLFLASTVPPLVFGIILVVRIMAEKASGMDLGWDPVLRFLQVQSAPVALLALGLGTPLVSRDRSEDVLYLYAVRPVSPMIYAVGKMLAVAFPTMALLLIPGVLIAILRQGLMPDTVHTGESLLLVAKVALASFFVAWAYAGISVGPSAATKRSRWALLLADTAVQLIWRDGAYAVGPANAAVDLMEALLGGGEAPHGWVSAGVLAAYAVIGALVIKLRVQREMTP